MSQQTENLMKKIYLNKVVLNMGIGQSGERIETAKAALMQITEGKLIQDMLKRHKEIGELERVNLLE